LIKQLIVTAVLCCTLPQIAFAGEQTIISSYFSPLPLAVAGLLIIILSLWRQIRRLRQEKYRLVASLQSVEQIIDQVPLPILRFDTDLTILAANRCSLQSCEQPSLIRASLLDQHPEFADHPALVARRSVQEAMLPATTAHAANREEQDADGKGMLSEITVDGQTQFIWIGPLPGKEQQLQAIGKAACEADESTSRMKSEFIANINHEVRTPMNAIIGYTEMLANSELGPREKRFVTIIHKSSMALVSIFNDIMELSKIDSGRLHIAASPVRLSSITNEVEGLFKDAATEKGIRLSCRIARHLPQSFLLDGVRLKQILHNLVSNAIKFTQEGSIEISVNGALSTEMKGCFNLWFTVEDTGIGISSEEQEKIFELFGQQEDIITRQYAGVGLGLTLCYRLTMMMGGRIALTSSEGEGTRITVFLNSVQLAQQVPAELEFERAAKGPARKCKLLVVDDVDLIKHIFVDFFKGSPYTVLTAGNGEDAFNLAVAEQPAIIFMDLNLSGTDGRNVTEKLRRTAATALIPVVVMTGEILEEEDYRPLFDDFLQKPFRLETLKEIVVNYTCDALLQPAMHGSADGEGQPLDEITAGWNTNLEMLRRQASSSGSLSDAASLGLAMRESGVATNLPLLAELGGDLIHYANEPDILGVDRLLAKLSKVVDRKDS
jgi:signal transduction histidine kinase/CheY-like chemotaxis protein